MVIFDGLTGQSAKFIQLSFIGVRATLESIIRVDDQCVAYWHHDSGHRVILEELLSHFMIVVCLPLAPAVGCVKVG